MQKVSKAYKESMKMIGRNRGYIRATIGVINSSAQKNVRLDKQTAVTYFSNTEKPFNNFTVGSVYATAEQDFSHVDGSMYFLPATNSGYQFYNNGIVTADLLGAVYISFGGITGLDIKGLTIDFGEYYPIDFSIESDSGTHYYCDNDKSYWTTEDVFNGTSYFIIRPGRMKSKNGRLRIYQFYCGIANAFENKDVTDYTEKEYVSSITDSIPSMDVTLTVDNQNQYYSPDNPDSALAYMETGQEVRIQFGYDVDGMGTIEWTPERLTHLKSWSASDTQAKFTATDIFDYMDGTYYRGLYRQNGISLYDLAIDVLSDAGVTDGRDYFIDPYLKGIKVYNPMPAVKHTEALQIIANAGRCTLCEDRTGRICMKSSFVPRMTARSNGEMEYSHSENLLVDDTKAAYAEMSNNFSAVDGTMTFMPSNRKYINTGYISKAIWYHVPKGSMANRLSFRLGSGAMKQLAEDEVYWDAENPKIIIDLESGFVSYGLIIKFRNVTPEEFKITTYYQNVFVEERTVTDTDLNYITYEKFDLFDRMEITFLRGAANSRVFVDNILIGDVTDYNLTRNDMTASPTAERQSRIKSIGIVKNIYKQSSEKKDLVTGELTISPQENTYIVYFNNASYGLSAEIDSGTDESGKPIPTNVTVRISESSNYYAKLVFGGITKETDVKYVVKGYEYIVDEVTYKVPHNSNGDEVQWNNPLISTTALAKDLEKWLASYYLGDVDYQISWRGDPRVDANDLFYLELKDRGNTLIRTYQNEMKFNGAWSGSMKARKAVL